MATEDFGTKIPERDTWADEWLRVREMLGVTDLAFKPEAVAVTHRANKPSVLEITFRRELTSYELLQFQRIMRDRPWPSESPD